MSDSPGEAFTRALSQLSSGNAGAADDVLPLVYDELKQLARGYLHANAEGHTLQPTALVHEAYLRMVRQDEVTWRDRAHFFAIAAVAMRQILISHARAKHAAKRGGSERNRVTLDGVLASADAEGLDLLELEDALTELAKRNARHARVAELRVFGGLTIEEVSHVLGVTDRTVKSDWRFAKAWLKAQLFERD